MAEEYYWVVHVVGGQKIFLGPYSSYESAENRSEHIQGGEVHILRTWSNNPEQAQQEFASEMYERA